MKKMNINFTLINTVILVIILVIIICCYTKMNNDNFYVEPGYTTMSETNVVPHSPTSVPVAPEPISRTNEQTAFIDDITQ